MHYVLTKIIPLRKSKIIILSFKRFKTVKRILFVKFFLLIFFCFGCHYMPSFKSLNFFSKSPAPQTSRSGPFNAADSLKEANEKIQAGDLYTAKVLLEEIIAQDATKRYEPLARIRLGDIHYKKGEYEVAAEEYKRFLDAHPHHEQAPLAQYRYGMCFLKRIKKMDTSYEVAKKALQEFRKLRVVYPRNPYSHEIEDRIQMCMNLLAEYEFYVGNFYFKKGSYRAASKRFQYLLRHYPHTKNESEVLLKLGIAYSHINEEHRAIETFRTIVHNYPHTKSADKARKKIPFILR